MRTFTALLALQLACAEQEGPQRPVASVFPPPSRVHWSLRPIERPAEPAVASPEWARNPIDRFVLARLEEAGLTPAEPAQPWALMRRLTLDLTGLPPSAEEVEQFVRDPSDAAYAATVDRLLADPAFGEHRAHYWLDAARYADTHGYHFDNERSIWPYRDYVVGAFVQGKPFDQFTIEQLAGDLLEDATAEQRAATGFIRNAMSTNEGGGQRRRIRGDLRA